MTQTSPRANVSWPRRLWRMLFWTIREFIRDRVPRLGAALAFYTTIAVAPLLVLAIAAAGLVFDENEARERVMGQIEQLAGAKAVEALETVEPPQRRGRNVFATVVGGITLVVGALSVFRHLQDALNEIWRSAAPAVKGWRAILERRLFSFGLVVVTGFILLVSLVVSAGLTWLAEQHWSGSGQLAIVAQTINIVLPFLVVTFLFATIFKVLPDTPRPVPWRDVWYGAAVTAILFTLGKSVLSLYLARASTASAYGVAGSVITLLLWTYYAAQIVLLGAEFTRIQALTRGGRIEPREAEKRDSGEPSRA